MTINMPKGYVFELLDNDINSQNYGRKFKFDFSYIASKSIKNVVMAYVWRNYIEGNKVVYKLYTDAYGFKVFYNYAVDNNIHTFKFLTNNEISMFVSYLKTRISNNANMQPLSYGTQKNHLDALKSIIYWGQVYMPDEVPNTEIFTGNEYNGVNRKLIIDFIPDEVLSKINKALRSEENAYVKYGIIILQSTGMRSGDMLKLTIDCIKPHLINGYTLTWYDHKKREQRQPMPITNECAVAIEKLIEHTKELREQAHDKVKDYLFLHQPNRGYIVGITVPTAHSFNRWLTNFIKNNDIRDTNGELYNLTAHHFRRTLATDMLSKGTNLNAIKEVLGHSFVSTTKQYYSDIKDKERGRVFKSIGIIGNINMVDETLITDQGDLKWFKDNKDRRAAMEDGYCTKPCTDGKICNRLLKRQKCYTCGRYITTPEYLEAHRNHLVELEKQLEGNIYGDHYEEHFLPTIEILREIIRRLEELEDGNREIATTSDN